MPPSRLALSFKISINEPAATLTREMLPEACTRISADYRTFHLSEHRPLIAVHLESSIFLKHSET